uniref:GK21672 n=1 Tax=Drosophila willistoni TaxID=7260 RepID=B4MPA0_DROWI
MESAPESPEELELQCGLKWQSVAGQKKYFYKSIPPVENDTGVDLFSLYISVEFRGGFDNPPNWKYVAQRKEAIAGP